MCVPAVVGAGGGSPCGVFFVDWPWTRQGVGSWWPVSAHSFLLALVVVAGLCVFHLFSGVGVLFLVGRCVG